MSDRHAVVNNYIAMWNETDARQRRELAARVVTEDADYVDPLMTGDGIDQISAMIGGAQEQYPGHRFALVSGPDDHHDRVRFSWSLAPNGGAPIANRDRLRHRRRRRPDALDYRVPGAGRLARCRRARLGSNRLGTARWR